MNKYLVVTGNEYGFDLNNLIDLSFNDLKKSEEIYNEYMEECGCAAMYKVNEFGLELIKMESDF